MKKSLYPLPTIDLDKISNPTDGLFLPLSQTCKNRFGKNAECKAFYEELSKLKTEGFHQCPCGFGCKIVITQRKRIAITGFISYPRFEGELVKQERHIAKKENKHKISREQVDEVAKLIKDMDVLVEQQEKDALQNYSHALHEIKKLNRTVKQTAERLNNGTQENEQGSFLRIFKASQMMSNQFDIVEALANEDDLTKLPLSRISDVYKLLDKCIKIYDEGTIELSHPSVKEEFHPQVKVCEKTFPIILTVLITNAIKYSQDDSTIKVTVDKEGEKCVIKVVNICDGNIELSDGIYLKGTRLASDSDGSGYGLYVAQKIANQHSTIIQHRTVNRPEKDETVVIFSLELQMQTEKYE